MPYQNHSTVQDLNQESQGVPWQHLTVSGRGKGATLPWVTARSRTRLPTALQGVPPATAATPYGEGVVSLP